MNICRNCKVELEHDMNLCPLCEHPLNTYSIQGQLKQGNQQSLLDDEILKSSQKKLLWQVTTVVLGLTMVVTLLLNIILNKAVSWSEYPIAICIILFTYITVYTFKNT